MGDLAYRWAAPRDLRAVLAAYQRCFDKEQRRRTVAHSPSLFRFFYGREMKAGRCKVAVAEDAAAVVGFAIVREDGPATGPWLLSAIGVVPERRGAGVAKCLFEMVATRPIRLTVEEQGPVRFYESLGLRRDGELTLIYVRARECGALAALAGPGEPAQEATARAVNWSTTFVSASVLTPEIARRVCRKTRLGRTVVLQLPGRFQLPEGTSLRVFYEFAFSTRK